MYEIEANERVTRGKEGVKSGKRHAVRPLMRGAGPQRAIYGDNYTVEWGKQKNRRDGRRVEVMPAQGEGEGGGRALRLLLRKCR